MKLVTPDNRASNTNAPLANPSQYVDVTFNAPAGTPYTIWLRLKALNNNKFNDSVWVQFSDARVNGSAVYPIGCTSGLLVNLATDSTGSEPEWVGLAERRLLAVAGGHGDVRDERHAHAADPDPRGRRATRSNRPEQHDVPELAARAGDQRFDDRGQVTGTRVYHGCTGA